MLLFIKLYFTLILWCVSVFTYYTYKLHTTNGDRLDYDKNQYYNKLSLRYGVTTIALVILGFLLIVWL